ncbi:MAG: apolipoprotein N-acyltransferase [Planctomycetaceae bacterium]
MNDRRALCSGCTLPLAAWFSAKASLTGLLLSTSWLYPSLFLISLLGQACLIAFAMRHRPMVSLLFGSLAGSIALSTAFHWSPASIAETTNLVGPWPVISFLVLIVWESLIFGLFLYVIAAATRFDGRLIWLAPAWWVTFEYLWPRVFTWALAHTHTSVVPILQLAEFTGTSGVSAILVLAATAIAVLFAPRGQGHRWRGPAVSAVAILSVYGWGIYRVAQVESDADRAPKLRIAAIQVDPSFVDSVERLRNQTLTVHNDVDLVLWPESSLGHYHESLTDFNDPIRTSELSEAPNPAEDPTDGFQTPLLAGGKTYTDGGRDCGPYCNTAFLIDTSKSIIGRYVKRTLMPVGEYIPGEYLFPAARQLAALDSALVRGSLDDPLPLKDGAQIGTLICYEDMVRDNSRRTVLAGASCLVALINGSGFRDADTLAQHQRLAMMRTIENRRGLVRCAATGVTCYVSPAGQVEQALPLGIDGRLVAVVPQLNHLTLYTRWGEWFTWLCIAVTAVVVGFVTNRSGSLRVTD